ncbi:unnamed protein product [Schistosoma rodhaini]|nr:unnamed protein product [Schistosoma rodhaini]
MIESSELQTIDLYALHSNDNITLWLEYCQCKYLNKCMNIMNNTERSEELSSINVSHILQSKYIYNELLKNTDDELKGRNIQKRDIHIDSMNQSIVDTVSEFHQDDLNTINLSSYEQTTHPMSQTENINKDPDPLNSNQIRSNSLSNVNEDTLEYQNMVQNDIFMPKIGSKLNEMYIDDNNLASDTIDDETTTAAMATPFENYTSSEVLNESYSTTTMDDTNISVTTNIETITPSNKISVLTTYPTSDLPSYENTTSSIIVISNERIHDDNHSVKMKLSKIDNKSIMNYSIEYPSLPCHTSCPLIQGKRYCWGPGRDQCQAVHKCQIRLCEGSNWCFRTKSNEYYQKNLTYYKMNFITSSKEQCCHSECAASCYGPRARDCNACLRLSNRGVCTDSCPASKKYNKSTFSWVENPDGLLTFGMICVKSCPKTYLRDDDHCVSKCARPGYMAYQGECIPCPNSICPKICTLNEIESIKGIDYLHRKSLHAMENCTVFEGDIKLSMQSFIGDPFYNLSQIDEGVKWKDLIIGLSKLEYITGTLYISAGSHAPWMTNLTFLSNVKIIGGKGRGAVCDELCQPHSGCWGPGRQFCTLCKYWSIENIDNSGRICVEHCEDLPGFYTPKLNDTHSNLEQMITDRSNIMIDVQNLSTAVYNNEINKSTTEFINKYYSKENKIFSSAQCKKCSDMCSLQNQTCYGPNDDQCIGLCRFVQDGPFCRAYCPPNKYTDPITKKCMECSSTCTPPGDIENGNIYINNNLLNQKIETKLKYYCTGSGDWPGNGGCSFCKQTVLYLEPKNSNHHLKCANSCPFGTYQHVINLHHRGGSSVDRQSTVYFNMKEQDSSMNRFTWSQTDVNLFYNFPSKIIDEISLWLLNHTQPQLYGLAQICLPCNEQCHSEIIPSRQLNLIGSSNVACYGPSPEQCVRCAYASYQGRCVSTCPSGTYLKKKSLRNFDPTLLNDYYIGYLPDNITSFECLSCHKECEIGCNGPTAEECTRCRHVKIYHDSQMESWLCNLTCPDFSPFKIFDQKTGEIICSSDSINLHIIPYYNGHYSIENHLNSTILHNSYNNNIVTMATKNLNFLQNVHMMNYNNIWHYNYLSTQTAGLISSLSALFIMLLLLSLIIYWTIYKRSKYIRIEQYDTTDNTTDNNKGNKSCFISLNKMCENFWTQGKPQLMMKKEKNEKNKKEKRKKKKTFTIATKNHRSILNYKNNQLIKEKLLFHPLNWNHSLIQMNGSLLLDKDNKWMNNMDEEKSPTHSESLKPNMATLRIITESELIRGPLIGSGAFGTVYCGIWCPKFTQQKLDPINNDTCSAITNSTITPTPNVFNSKKFDWDKNTNGIETIPVAFNNDNDFNLHIPVAIKVLSDSADPQTNKELLEEAKVMATVDHPCCVRFLALCLTSKLQLITQYLPLGSLLEFIKIRWDFIEVNSLFQWSEQIASGMIYLSSRGIIHRDLAARNVLVQSKDQVSNIVKLKI